jgi:hypothetical protein
MSCGWDVGQEAVSRDVSNRKENMKKLQAAIFGICLAGAMSASASLIYSDGNLVTAKSVPVEIGDWNSTQDPSVIPAGLRAPSVPEPTTMLAGVLLLPFGASALRMLRRKQTA